MIIRFLLSAVICFFCLGAHAAEVEKRLGGFQFTEGPAPDAHGNLFFSDIEANKIYKIEAGGKLSVEQLNSHHADGLKVGPGGELYACELEGQVVAYAPDGTRRVVAASYDGKRFNAPNDLTFDSTGGFYFTDPRFFAPNPLPQGVEAVYYVDAQGVVTRVIDDVAAPNGIVLSPDGKTLYVVPSLQPEIFAYPVLLPGKIGDRSVFASLKKAEGQKFPAGDGATVDAKGDLYATSNMGIQIFSPEGKPLGIITVPEQPANLAFMPNGTLFITARTALYTTH